MWQPKPIESTGWKCSGNMNTGKFCSQCGNLSHYHGNAHAELRVVVISVRTVEAKAAIKTEV